MAVTEEKCGNDIYAVYYSKYDGDLLYQDVFYEVRKHYYETGKRQKNKVVKDAAGVCYRFAYQLEQGQPMRWKKLLGFKPVEYSENTSFGYRIVTQDEDKRVVKIAYFGHDHGWLKTEYFAPELKRQPMEILEKGPGGGMLRRELQGGRHDNGQELFSCEYPSDTDERRMLSNAVQLPEIVVRTRDGDFYYASSELSEQCSLFLSTLRTGGKNGPAAVFSQPGLEVPDTSKQTGLFEEPDREGGFMVAPSVQEEEKEAETRAEAEDGSYVWGATTPQLEKYNDEPFSGPDPLPDTAPLLATEPASVTETESPEAFEKPDAESGVKYTEQYEYPYLATEEESAFVLPGLANDQEAVEEDVSEEDPPAYTYDKVTTEHIDDPESILEEEESGDLAVEERMMPKRYNVVVKPMSADTYTASDRIAPLMPREVISEDEAGSEALSSEKAEIRDICNGVMNGCPYIGTGKMSISVSSDESYYYYGEVETGLRQGRGRTAMMNGCTAYEGDYENDQRNGFGVYYYKSGKLCYAGGWRDNRRDGLGVSFKAADGSLYAGMWKDDEPVGAGAMLTRSGGLAYAGGYANGKRHGAGVAFSNKTGNLIVGSYQNGVRSSKGTEVDAQGLLLYTGEFREEKRHGTGTEYDSQGQVLYTGCWKDGVREGAGVLYREDRHVIKGEFLNGAVNGHGVEYSKNGVKIYEGQWENNRYHGRGCRYFPGGGRYEGNFVEGLPTGWLKGYDADGSLVYEGHWENDQFQGEGRYFSNGEKVYEGGFAHNQFEGEGTEYFDGEITYRGSFVGSNREGLGVVYENGQPRFAGEFRDNRMEGRVNEIENGLVKAECIFHLGELVYQRRFEFADSEPFLCFEGFMKDGLPGGMGCRFNRYGEKLEEGLFKDGSLLKSMQVTQKHMPALPENPVNPAFEAYRFAPEFGVELPVAGGVYTGRLKDGVPNGRGTLLLSDHRYTGEFYDGVPEGRGVLYRDDGDVIEGDFVKNGKEALGYRRIRFENGVEYYCR